MLKQNLALLKNDLVSFYHSKRLVSIQQGTMVFMLSFVFILFAFYVFIFMQVIFLAPYFWG